MSHPAALTGPAADEVVAAVWELRRPDAPGTPWDLEDVVAMLPLLAQGPSTLDAEAWGARLLAAVDEGEIDENE